MAWNLRLSGAVAAGLFCLTAYAQEVIPTTPKPVEKLEGKSPLSTDDKIFSKDTKEIVGKTDDDRRDLTGLYSTGSTYFHPASRTAMQIPTGWDVIRPNRLQRKQDVRTSTTLGLEKSDREYVATLYWLPLGTDVKWSDIIREQETLGEFGEEHATLVTIYGKKKVSVPTKAKFGGFDVFKILIDDGPDKDGKNAGTIYLFETGTGENRWKIKLRITYPYEGRVVHDKNCEEVLKNFMKLQ